MKPNSQVGQYVLERPLGEGGKAEVWLGRNVHLGIPVAIKFLKHAGDYSPEAQQRFLDEGSRQGVLDHPNIIKVHGFEIVDSCGFLILQYVDGGSLQDLLSRCGRLDAVEAVRIALPILSALDYAGDHAIVHGDIKPSNILLDSSGVTFVGDFGMALAGNEPGIRRAIGPPENAHYMSPERIMKVSSIDCRGSDIYSFGCVLYEMLAGEPPFDGESEYAIKFAHVQQTPPPLKLGHLRWIEQAVLRRCLDKEPRRRFATFREFRDTLFNAMRPIPQCTAPGN